LEPSSDFLHHYDMEWPTYQYRPVHLIKNSLDLRLVTILPGFFDDPVKCTLSYDELIIDPQDEGKSSHLRSRILC
jgi:hypothetical protein